MDKKILVAEDEVGIRQQFYDSLTHAGYKVVTTHHGKHAFELFTTQKPDLVLLDYGLSDESGIEVLRKIKEIDKKAKVVMLGSPVESELEKEARLLGASGFLPKSLEGGAIVEAVDRIMGKSIEERKILVVDDDPQICSLIEDFLTKKGFRVIVAYSGEEGLEKFKKERPILVLLDVRLPGMDGIMTLKRIKEIDPRVGVIMVTGLKDEDTFNEAKKLGAHEYVVKPFDLDYLDTCVLVRLCLVSALLR
ncbi:MAG: response regulator [Candidatus Omnitrophica bacterium]|nr:response regulator [Candidatus Omnitrophota bacterium]